MRCPKCGSYSLIFEGEDGDEETMIIFHRCDACNFYFEEVWHLTFKCLTDENGKEIPQYKEEE